MYGCILVTSCGRSQDSHLSHAGSDRTLPRQYLKLAPERVSVKGLSGERSAGVPYVRSLIAAVAEPSVAVTIVMGSGQQASNLRGFLQSCRAAAKAGWLDIQAR
jgi:hypothetical protein